MTGRSNNNSVSSSSSPTANHRTSGLVNDTLAQQAFSHSLASPVNHNSSGFIHSTRPCLASIAPIPPTAASSPCNAPFSSMSRELYSALLFNSQVNCNGSVNLRNNVNLPQQQHHHQQQNQQQERRVMPRQSQEQYQRVALSSVTANQLIPRDDMMSRATSKATQPIAQETLYSTVRSVKQASQGRPLIGEYAAVKASKSSHNLANTSSLSYCQVRPHLQQQQQQHQQQQKQQVQHSPCYSAISRGSSAQSTGSLDSISNECTVCYEAPINTVLYMCGHMCMCYECAIKQWRAPGGGQCPICRAHIKDIIRTYRS